MQVWTGKLSGLQLPAQNPTWEGPCTSVSLKDRYVEFGRFSVPSITSPKFPSLRWRTKGRKSYASLLWWWTKSRRSRSYAALWWWLTKSRRSRSYATLWWWWTKSRRSYAALWWWWTKSRRSRSYAALWWWLMRGRISGSFAISQRWRPLLTGNTFEVTHFCL